MDFSDRLKRMTLMDDEFMTVCFARGTAFAELILRILLENDGLVVKKIETQRTARNLLRRGVRFDVLAQDASGALYNIEVQRASDGAGPERARFHISILDANVAEQGRSFKDLP